MSCREDSQDSWPTKDSIRTNGRSSRRNERRRAQLILRRSGIMAVQENTEIVKGIYEAFGRGDIPAILNSLADNIEWIVSGREDGIPYARSEERRVGKEC